MKIRNLFLPILSHYRQSVHDSGLSKNILFMTRHLNNNKTDGETKLRTQYGNTKMIIIRTVQ